VAGRVVHAKGTGAHGFFEVTEDVTQFAKASLFAQVGKRTRCSRASHRRWRAGFAHSARDPAASH
jgi:catalase